MLQWIWQSVSPPATLGIHLSRERIVLQETFFGNVRQ
jgi:hypothetical protein